MQSKIGRNHTAAAFTSLKNLFLSTLVHLCVNQNNNKRAFQKIEFMIGHYQPSPHILPLYCR